jgi:hypothetical protein
LRQYDKGEKTADNEDDDVDGDHGSIAEARRRHYYLCC